MKQTAYQLIHDLVNDHSILRQAVIACTRILPGIVYVSYPVILLYLLFSHNPNLLRTVIVPAVGFIVVTALRASINAPRPYEVMNIPPISHKETKGKSFPSRHAACAAVIAITILHVLPIFGILLCIIALLIGLSRILAGVHFLRDILAGLLLGGLIGWIGVYVIP